MIEDEKSRRVPPMSSDERTLTWLEEHLPDLKEKYVSGQRLLYQFLMFGFVVGLAAHVGSYVLLSSAPTGLRGLSADLLHALGGSLWTGVVLSLFVQVIPEVKRRQIKQALDAYEAVRQDGQRAGQ
jgi:Tfp pilus assembly protein PilN